ncbi:hypothetical protein ASD8599_01660 [Ascidiaceihabitans donghaensis]|uniref:DUF924 domain-containing protein n=1 Tax=Ascidiaceihabitans donghaensis TaxID=1510460 RepID=A0A2R8BDB0_9RHOB|nr:DUF924 family protein [Ascidiaceihabitans donghaensis]SPH20919.1 hypothetical protein ASD8599_01660 [Ascidiaceihabitans donghaensis]
MVGPEDVLKFWLDDLQPKDWYKDDEALDQQIRDTFLSTWEGASEGRFSLWLTYPSGALAYILLTDQLSRNMFRGTGRAFSSDRLALAAAKSAIAKGWDMKIDEPARQFFYLPLMHSENLCDQDRCVRLICERMPIGREDNLIHARAHRDVIRQFGRFPYRNAALGRSSTSQEDAYLAGGGYGSTLRQLQAAKAA